jgi:hypothetical protein
MKDVRNGAKGRKDGWTGERKFERVLQTKTVKATRSAFTVLKINR